MERESSVAVPLKTIDDLIAVATDDNIDRLMHDLRNHIQLCRHHDELMGVPGATMPSVFNWLDSGRTNVYINMSKNEWAPTFLVGRVLMSRPDLFGDADQVVVEINETGVTIVAASGQSWCEALAEYLAKSSVDENAQ